LIDGIFWARRRWECGLHILYPSYSSLLVDGKAVCVLPCLGVWDLEIFSFNKKVAGGVLREHKSLSLFFSFDFEVAGID